MTSPADFVLAERFHYLPNDNNLFAFSLSQATRYFNFLRIIPERYKDESKRAMQ